MTDTDTTDVIDADTAEVLERTLQALQGTNMAGRLGTVLIRRDAYAADPTLAMVVAAHLTVLAIHGSATGDLLITGASVLFEPMPPGSRLLPTYLPETGEPVCGIARLTGLTPLPRPH